MKVKMIVNMNIKEKAKVEVKTKAHKKWFLS